MNPLNKIGNIEEMLKLGIKAVNDRKISHYDEIESLTRDIIDCIEDLTEQIEKGNDINTRRNLILEKIYNELGTKK